MDLSVIIVNWNTKKLLDRCLTSIFKFTEALDFEVSVVDNGSQDGSQALVKQKFPRVMLIPNKDNLGFTKANNQGIKIANGEYILLLNSDTYLIENSLKKLVDNAKNLDNLGALGPQLLNEDQTIQQSAGFFPHLPQVLYWMCFLDDLPGGMILKPYHIDHDSFYQKDRQVDWVTGAAILVPRRVIGKIGGLDENIFMYGEEVDWCYRIKQQKFKVFYSPATKIIHIGRGSTGKISKNAILGEYKGIKYFYRKHKSPFALQILSLLLKIGALARIAIFAVLGRKETSQFYAEALKVA